MQRTILSATLVLAALVAGCAQDSPTPTAVAADSPLFAKPGGGGGGGSETSDCGGKTQLRDSRADLRWPSDNYAIRDDGGGTYQGGVGAVHGKIFYHDLVCSRSGDLVFDPDGNSGTARYLYFYFPEGNELNLPPNGVKSAPWLNFQAIQFLGSDIGEPGVIDGRDAKVEEKNLGAPRAWEYPWHSAERPDYPTFNGTKTTKEFRFRWTGIAGCEELQYDKISMTRSAGKGLFEKVSDSPLLGQWSHLTGHLGEWVVESVATEHNGVFGHWAQCLVSRKGQLVPAKEGYKMSMPFTVTINEVRR